jgi:hypothetical protein
VHDRGPLVVRAAAFLLEQPYASANAVARSVPGRRQDVLWAVRELRAAHSRFRSPENRGRASVEEQD